MTEVHAHKVLNLLRETPMTLTELRSALTTQFGEQVRFHTCKMQDLELDALVEFFLAREKVILKEEKLVVNMERVCNH